jgi:DNA invertase Pin-like site-specific DNA recombinase
MGKVLLFLRTSTEKQEFENQKKEMQDYVKSMGYSEADCVYLEKAGASAIKYKEFCSIVDCFCKILWY